MARLFRQIDAWNHNNRGSFSDDAHLSVIVRFETAAGRNDDDMNTD